jgi:hypothetical protein
MVNSVAASLVCVPVLVPVGENIGNISERKIFIKSQKTNYFNSGANDPLKISQRITPFFSILRGASNTCVLDSM